MTIRNTNTAYVIGVAIGDGNLSNPNGRATRLRVTCDNKYPVLIKRIIKSLEILLPNNKVSIYERKTNCTDVSCYSNKLESILGWTAHGGPKSAQRVTVPAWIFSKKTYVRNCLRGLLETDGSVYQDRKYTYVNFTSIIPELIDDVQKMVKLLGYTSTTNAVRQESGKIKYVVRICKDSIYFLGEIKVDKS